MANLAPLAKLVCHAHHKHRIPIGVLGKRMIDAVKVAQPVEAVTETLAHGELQTQVKPFFPLILHSDTHWQDYGERAATNARRSKRTAHADDQVWRYSLQVHIFRTYAEIEKIELNLRPNVIQRRTEIIYLPGRIYRARRISADASDQRRSMT